MLTPSELESFIEKIWQAEEAAVAAQESVSGLESKITGLAAQIQSGINGDGDPAELAQEVSLLRTQREIHLPRLSKAKEALAAANHECLRTIAGVCGRCEKAMQQVFTEKQNERRREFEAMNDRWGVPANVRMPFVCTCSQDRLQPLRDVILSLGDVVNTVKLGRGGSARDAVSALISCRDWITAKSPATH